jgi:predicted lipoprotein with Yx(FWY)xxD motif
MRFEMKTRFVRVLTVISALALMTARAALAAAVTVRTGNDATLGTVVVNSGGLTVYHNTKETHGKIVCTGSCATTWPPLLVGQKAMLKAGHGIKAADLGRIKRPDGRFQVTYFGMPLYRYAGDAKAGQANGESLGGIWFAIRPNGKLAKPSSSGTSTTTTTTTTTTPGY